MQKLIFTILCLSGYMILFGQVDTTEVNSIDLEEIVIAESKLPPNAYLVSALSSINNLDQSLSANSLAYVRSFGLNSSSTMSILGGNANQVQIQWEGISINNPMLGVSDISLVPTAFFNKVELIEGSNSAKEGNAAMTGVLKLSSEPAQNSILSLSSHHESFGRKEYKLNGTYHFKNWSLHLNAFKHQANNDFDYLTALGNKKIQTHAETDSKGSLLTLAYNKSNIHNFKIHYWHQSTLRQIPPTTTQNSSLATQTDKLQRILIKSDHAFKQFKISPSLAYFDEFNGFSDPLSLSNENIFRRILHKNEFLITQDNSSVNLGYELSTINGSTNNYEDGSTNLDQLNLYGGFKIPINHFVIEGQARYITSNFGPSPFLPSLKLTYNKDKLTVIGDLSKEYRLPTMNELFWKPGGNTALKPESGWQESLKIIYQWQENWVSKIHLFHRNIENWLLWSPLAGEIFYSASNLANVRSYGLILKQSYSKIIDSHQIRIRFNYAYTRSKNLVSLTRPLIEENQQLFYTPEHRLQASLSYDYQQCSLHWTMNHSGKVNGVLSELEGYFLQNLSLKYTYNRKRYSAKISFNIENLTNSNYRLVENRPMPGRYYGIGYALSIY